MTADVLDFPSAADRADGTIRMTIAGLLHGRGIRVEEAAAAVNMTPSTLYRRLAGSPFKAGEVAALAVYLGVEVSDLYSGLGGRFTPTTPGGPLGDPGSGGGGLNLGSSGDSGRYLRPVRTLLDTSVPFVTPVTDCHKAA